MAEQLFTIPVNEAFDKECECALCVMYNEIENTVLDFVMGPSYMEDDVRSATDKSGFCKEHIKKIYDKNNRLGMAWILKTHMDKIQKDISILQSGGILKKNSNEKLLKYLDELNNSCYICNKLQGTFERYIATIFHLWKTDDTFADKYKKSKGFCSEHYALLIETGEKKLGGRVKEEFINVTNKLYLENIIRVRDDVAWFINKFDYKYKDEPWKEAKDSLQRAMIKLDSYID